MFGMIYEHTWVRLVTCGHKVQIACAIRQLQIRSACNEFLFGCIGTHTQHTQSDELELIIIMSNVIGPPGPDINRQFAFAWASKRASVAAAADKFTRARARRLVAARVTLLKQT